MTNRQIIDKIKSEVLETYPPDGINIVIPSEFNYVFQLTTSINELKSLNESNTIIEGNDLPVINLKECESLLKEFYNISYTDPLIILKFEKLSNISIENDVQYEIYSPITFEKLDLSICIINDKDIEFIIPIKLEESFEKTYNSLKKEGYDLFDINNKFYIDICSHFTAENGADILLDDRIIYFYNKYINITTCPNKCSYSKFSIETKSLSCQCEASKENINIEKINELNDYSLYTPSLRGYKYTSYKTMKCYKLVFNYKHFAKNAGSIVILIIFIIYIIFMIYYLIKDISPLRVVISKLLFDEKESNKDNNSKINNQPIFLSERNKNNKKRKIENKSINKSVKEILNKTIKIKNDLAVPPKKSRTNKVRIDSGKKANGTEDLKLLDLISKKKKLGKKSNFYNTKIKSKNNNRLIKNNKKVDFDVESLKSDKVRKRKSIIDYQRERDIKIYEAKEKEKEKILLEISDKRLYKSVNKKDVSNEAKTEIKQQQINIKQNEADNKILDDYELNHLDYDNAIVLDKRDFCKLYWSIIKRDELLLFTFVTWDDYNLFYVKIEKFLFVILTLMAMNGFLFSDKSIHKLFLNGVKYDFGQQILQIILSVIITHVFEILLCFLSLTDRYIYKIKSLSKSDSKGDNLFNYFKKMRIGLIIFLVLIFIFSIIYWYFISAFCAVYENTQGIYIIDCIISLLFFLVDPFIIYALVCLIRKISINKKVKCLYKLSQLFPIF